MVDLLLHLQEVALGQVLHYLGLPSQKCVLVHYESLTQKGMQLLVPSDMLRQRVGQHVARVRPQGVSDPSLCSSFSKGHDDQTLRPILRDTFLAGLQLPQILAIGDDVDGQTKLSKLFYLYHQPKWD